MFIFEKKVFKSVAVLLFFLIFSMTLYAKTTVIISDDFDDDEVDSNALGWSYNIEKEDVENPNEIFHDNGPKAIVVRMNNKADNDSEWFTEVRRQGLTLKAGVTYTVTAQVMSTADTKIQLSFDKMAAPYGGDYSPRKWSAGDPVTVEQLTANEEKTISLEYTPDKDYYGCKLTFCFDGELYPYDIDPYETYIYEVSVIAEADDSVEVPIPEDYSYEASMLGVNQLGYLPNSKKIAIFRHNILYVNEDPKDWTLYNSEDEVVASGKTIFDKRNSQFMEPGSRTQTIDFSDVTELGTGYYITVTYYFYVLPWPRIVKSEPFDIANDIYSGMADDALNYFYYNRSGIEINLGDEEQHRPAGHPDDEAEYPETGETYDVSGGWYDAGDYGKYTVTGTYSIWMLLNLYEQYKYEVNGLIPEDADEENGINDLLDEARYELEFLWKMQVPEEGLDGSGELAGAVFSKMHDEAWTSLPCVPYSHEKWSEEMDRILFKPTTTATLDFIAVMAQAWRIWRDLDDNEDGDDDEFAEDCKEAALAAYTSLDELGISLWTSNLKIDNGGGGPYDDIDPQDELYWALCELYISTPDDFEYNGVLLKEECLDKILDLEVDKEGDYYGFKEIRIDYQTGEEDGVADLPHSWKNVSGCGVLSLYAAKDQIENPEMIGEVEDAVIALADKLFDNVDYNPYNIPLGTKYEVFWGSNQTVINRALLLSCAYEISGDEKYLEGVTSSMDYLLGTNPLYVSYITGYGKNSPKNTHHRMWGGTIDPDLPFAPAGCLIGGSNPTLSDEFGLQNGEATGKDDINLKSHDPFVILGKIYRKSFRYLSAYVDSYESYSTNEVTINWNAALVCLAAVVDNLDIYKEDIEGLLDDIDTGEMVLTPDFQDDVFTYSSTVDHDVDSISITPTAIDNDSIIYVNGVLVESGQPSQEIDLVVGINTITIYVENTDGDSVTYIINITREEAPAVIVLTDQNTDNRNYTVNDELTFQILTGGSGVIQISSVVPYPSQVTVSINGGPYQPTPELWGGPFYVPANTNVIFKVKAAVPTDIVLNWW